MDSSAPSPPCNAPLDLTDSHKSVPEFLFPATLPCVRAEEVTADRGVIKRVVEEGSGKVVPTNAKVWLALEGRKDSGEIMQRDASLIYTIGIKSQKVISQGLVLAFATMRVGETAWIRLEKAYHLYPPAEAVWLKVRIRHAMEDFVDRLPKAASAEERAAFSEKLIQEANLAAKAGLHKEATTYYNRAIDGIRGFKAGSVGEWTPEEWSKLKSIHIRCEGNLAQVALDFSQVPSTTEVVRKKRLQEALAHCAVVLDLDPRHAKGLYRKSKAYLLLDDLEQAYAAVSECMKVAAGNHQVAKLYQDIQLRRRREEEQSRRRFQRVLQEIGKEGN